MAKDKFEITFDDALLPRIVDALCEIHGYKAEIPAASPGPDGKYTPAPNPENRRQFARRMVAEWIRNQVVQVESRRELRAAEQSAKKRLEAEIAIV